MLEIRPIVSALFRHKTSTLLIVFQIAITFAIVINSIAIINNRLALMDRESGLAENKLLMLNVSAYGQHYDIEQNYRADMETIRNLDGVDDAIAINQIPLTGSSDSGPVGSSKQSFDQFNTITTGYFFADSHAINTFGVKLIEGRNFTEEEVKYGSGRPESIEVTLVTKSLADKLFPDGNALGKTIYLGGDFQLVIIGIIDKLAGARVHSGMFEDNMLTPYIRLTAFKRYLIKAKSEADMNRLLGEIENVLLERNPNRAINDIRSMKSAKERSYRGDNAMTKILWGVILLLIAITALGIVGIVSFSINQRKKQIGTRRALGAKKADIQRYYITENLLISLAGLVLGSMMAVALNIYLIKTFSLTPLEWQYFPLSIATMLILGVVSVWAPARRASNISPTIATQSV